MTSILEWLKRIFLRKKPEYRETSKPKKKPEPREIVKPKKKPKKIPKAKPRKRNARRLKRIKLKSKSKHVKPKRVKRKLKPKIKKTHRAPTFKKRRISVPIEVIKEVIVADIMTKNPIAVNTNDTLSYVMRLFADKKISGVPVLQDENLVGVVSESDIIKTIGRKELLKQKAFGLKKLTEVKVGEVMHRNPVFVHEYTKLSDATDLMNKYDITRLVVLDDKRKIVGIVTRSDIIRGVAKELLYKILRKKEEERVKLKIDTDIDEVLKIVERKGSIDIDDIKKRLLLPEDKIEEWGKILESHGLLELFYPAVGKPKLRKKIR
jgi:CBS domain-containing protein